MEEIYTNDEIPFTRSFPMHVNYYFGVCFLFRSICLLFAFLLKREKALPVLNNDALPDAISGIWHIAFV